MNHLLAPGLACLLAASAQAAVPGCTAPVFPLQSTSGESVRRVEQQVSQWRACQALRASQQDPALTAAQDNEVDSAQQKWATATQLYMSGRFAVGPAVTNVQRDQREHLLTRLSPMPPVYGVEHK